MTVQEAICNYLLDQESIAEIVGEEIYTNHLPEGPQFPAITIRLVSAIHGRNLDGPNGTVRAKVQVEAWSTSFRQSQELGELVRMAVQGYVGMMDDLLIRNSALDSDIDTPEPPDDASEEWIYSKALIFELSYFETIPAH